MLSGMQSTIDLFEYSYFNDLWADCFLFCWGCADPSDFCADISLFHGLKDSCFNPLLPTKTQSMFFRKARHSWFDRWEEMGCSGWPFEVQQPRDRGSTTSAVSLGCQGVGPISICWWVHKENVVIFHHYNGEEYKFPLHNATRLFFSWVLKLICHGKNNLNASGGLEQKFTSKRSPCSM